ncbi:MAG: hypothetical protein KGK14_11450 [Bacteroidota bacterium]|nr:hypothetical protein [Bacteroidota bacterium]
MNSSETGLLEFYQNKIKAYAKKIHQLKNKTNGIAILRTLFFLGWLYLLYQYFLSKQTVFLNFSFLILAGFLALVSLFVHYNHTKKIYQNKLWFAQNETNVLQGKMNDFEDGSAFISNEGYLFDLDIFGKQSLFHLLNRTTTTLGKQLLCERLRHPILQKKELEAYHTAVKTYSKQYHILEEWIATALLHKQENESNNSSILLEQWVTNYISLNKRNYFNVIRFVLPSFSILALLYTLDSGNYAWLSACIILNWVHVLMVGKHNGKAFLQIGKHQEVLQTYSRFFKIFSKVYVEDATILKVQQSTSIEAARGIAKLSFIANLVHQRFNLLAVIVLNSFIMYDVHCAVLLSKWHKIHNGKLKEWLAAIGEIEYLNCITLFHYNNPNFVFPEIKTEGIQLHATNITHPMLVSGKTIANNFQLDDAGVILITGSNMSGKSTFLRTVGINLVLAEMGAPVCASYFSFTPMFLFSCIRVADSLQENTSYFMAELQKLQYIKNELTSHYPALILIDEILRGTNSADKYEGSAQFILQLIKQPCIVLFATHDLKLSNLEDDNPTHIKNYCFESVIENNQLSFDYVLRKGVAQNKNATFLMKKMGII